MCDHKRQVLALRQIDSFFVDEDDEFFNEIEEVDAFANIGIHYCLDCKDIVDIWIEEPYQAKVFQLTAENEAMANGALIIAAPDLLTASLMALEFLSGSGAEDTETAELLRAAIAKAGQ
jgi:hypothetical protein